MSLGLSDQACFATIKAPGTPLFLEGVRKCARGQAPGDESGKGDEQG